MAAKSPQAMHNQWPNVASTTQLPNVSGASIQDQTVEVGDQCYVTGTGTYQCDTATVGAAVWSSMGGGGSAAGVSSNLWAPPATPHAEDDEFEATTLTGWSVQNLDGPAVGSFSYNTVDAYDTTFNSGNVVRVSAHTDGKRSWALIQTPGSSDEFAIFKAYTLPTNLNMYSRLQFSQKAAGLGAAVGDSDFSLAFMTAATGVPTTASRIVLYVNTTGSGTYRADYSYYTTGGSRTAIKTTDDVDLRGQAIEYVAIHKVGTTYHGWVKAAGSWIYLSSVTEATLGFTPDLVGFCQHQVSTSNLVNPVGTDFIRFVETDKFLL